MKLFFDPLPNCVAISAAVWQRLLYYISHNNPIVINFLDILKIETVEILEVSADTAKFRLSLFPGSPKFSGIEISLSGDGLDVKREMRSGMKIFVLDLLQPETSYTMRVRVTDGARGHQMISDWSDLIYFRTGEEVESRLLPSVRQENNQWLAGVITGAILLLVCLIVVALVSSYHLICFFV